MNLNMNEPQKHAKWKKPEEKTIDMILYIWSI